MSYKEYLTAAMEATGEAVDIQLGRLIPEPTGPEAQVIEAMRYAMFAGGKRLRPFLVVSTADLFDVAKAHSLRVAAAVECIHTYSLIHDDLPAMDDDDLRRGNPTTHKKFDEATAILAGDGLQTLAFEILSHEATHPDPHVRCELMKCLAQASGVRGMVGGQMIDMAAEGESLNLAEITRLQQLKTGALITFAVEAGAILGKADQHRRSLLVAYARDVGLAFQIADDLLDIDGDVEVMGKATGKDADAGKSTFVSEMGAGRARKQADMLADQAIGHLGEFGDKSILLQGLAKFVVSRDH
jgi:farnesyl diphosphate synthase